MLKRMLMVIIGAAIVLSLVNGAESIPALGDAGKLEGFIRCSSRRPMVVYLDKEPKPSFETPTVPAVIDQKGLKFVPHVLPVLVGTRVAFLNSDPVRHNVFSASRTKPFNLGTYPSGIVRHVLFDRPGVVEILCNVHPEMSAYVVVLETPYYTLTALDGAYHIEGLPAGSYTVSVWCEKNGTRRRKVRIASGPSRLDMDMHGKSGAGVDEEMDRSTLLLLPDHDHGEHSSASKKGVDSP